MKNKPDAYELEWSGKLTNIVKCENCGFKCVYVQIVDNGNKCPKCGIVGNVQKGKLKK